ncbi:hypothetical protein E2C01_102415 [Portunus trituberculatus]|uniref:PHD-type domain-containing protein n=1 Tax=Portunus trituberculatus TaxID=210409 RepID=A0A5B7KIE1_PORTR|nr:hypothetical protein [Portunus trituberculatus]
MAEKHAISALSSSCYRCSSDSGDQAKFTKCCLCNRWAHTKCVNLVGIKSENICNVRYLCDVCFTEVSALKKFINDIEEFKSDLKSITAKTDKMMEIVDNKMARMEEISIKVDEATEGLTGH